jgi:hypothetical protein
LHSALAQEQALYAIDRALPALRRFQVREMGRWVRARPTAS